MSNQERLFQKSHELGHQTNLKRQQSSFNVRQEAAYSAFYRSTSAHILLML